MWILLYFLLARAGEPSGEALLYTYFIQNNAKI